MECVCGRGFCRVYVPAFCGRRQRTGHFGAADRNLIYDRHVCESGCKPAGDGCGARAQGGYPTLSAVQLDDALHGAQGSVFAPAFVAAYGPPALSDASIGAPADLWYTIVIYLVALLTGTCSMHAFVVSTDGCRLVAQPHCSISHAGSNGAC